MAQYAGTDTFAEEMTISDDGIPPVAATVNYGLRANADRTVYLRNRALEIGQVEALSFPSDVSASQSKIVKFSRFGAGSGIRQWMAVNPSSNDRFVRTTDPYVWPTSSEIPGGSLLAQPCWDFDSSSTGNICVTTTGGDGIWKYHGGIWGTVYPLFSATLTHSSCFYEPVTDRWCIWGLTSTPALVMKVTNNSGGTAFSTFDTATPPASPMPTSDWVVGNVNGLGSAILFGLTTSATSFYTATSTTGGYTWSATSTTAIGFTVGLNGNRAVRPVWVGDRWIVSTQNTATPRTKVWSSSDGLTWTEIADLSTAAINFLSYSNGLLLGITNAREMVISADKGLTWHWGTRLFANTINSLASSPCQFLVSMGTTTVHPSIAQGFGVAQVT